MDRPLLKGAVEVPTDHPGAYEENAFDLAHYWHLLRKRRLALGLTCLVVVVATLIAINLVRPTYRSVVTLQIERENPNILSFQEILQIDSRQEDFYQTQYMLLQSRSLLRRVIEQLHLNDHPDFIKALKRRAPAKTNELGWDARLVDVVAKDVQVLPVRRSRLVQVAVETHDPALSVALANTIASTFIDVNLEAKFETTETATHFLSAQIADLKKEIEQNKKNLQEYATKSKILSLDERQNITVQRLTDLNVSYTKAQADRIEAEARYRALIPALGLPEGASASQLGDSDTPPRDLDLGRVPEVASNQLVQTLRARVVELQTRYAEKSERFKPEWPEMVRLREQIAEIRSQVRSEQWRIVVGLFKKSDAEYRAALAREQALGRDLESQKQVVVDMNSSSILYNTLKAEIDNKSNLLDSLLKRKNETDVSARLKGLKSSNIRIVDRAEMPLEPYRPQKRLDMALSVVFGLLLGIGVVLVLEYLDNTIKSVEDIERQIGLPSLGVIPLFVAGQPQLTIGSGASAQGDARLPARQLGVSWDARSPAAEAYRSLRTSLLLSAAGSPPRFLLITSAQPSEGKTTTAVNVAIALAQAGKKVLVIDADLRKPRCHQMLGLSNKVGLTTFLTGAAPLKNVIQPTPINNLFMVTSGPIPPNPSELLGSARLKDLMEMVPPVVNHIIFDSPPLLTVTDATLLAALVDGVVIVARAGQSPRDLLKRTKKQLHDVNAKIIGVVLNSVNSRDSNYYYYHSYHRGYGEDSTNEVQ